MRGTERRTGQKPPLCADGGEKTAANPFINALAWFLRLGSMGRKRDF